MANSNNRPLFIGAIIVAIVALIICVYYVIPGYDHLFVSAPYKDTHVKHVFAFGALAVIGIIGALVTRPKSAK